MSRRSLAICTACLLSIFVSGIGPAARAATQRTHGCRSSDLRYPYTPGGPRTFGVFALRIAGGSCRTAHRVARDWMAKFEATLQAGTPMPPRRVDGFRFVTLPATAAQTYRERGHRRSVTIRFDYVVPNG